MCRLPPQHVQPRHFSLRARRGLRALQHYGQHYQAWDAGCGQVSTCYLLLVTCYSLLITYYLLLITHYLLLITFYSLHITYYLLLITYYLGRADCAVCAPGFQATPLTKLN